MADYPTDPDPAAFYALSLIAMVNSVGAYVDANEATALLAAARSILTGAAATFPEYAGILHYTVQVSGPHRTYTTLECTPPLPGVALHVRCRFIVTGTAKPRCKPCNMERVVDAAVMRQALQNGCHLTGM